MKMYYVSNDYLCHIGNENSGRYPRGSGKYPRAMRKGGILWRLKRHKKSKDRVEKLRKPTEKQIMEIINSGDAKKVYKYRRYLSTNDLNVAKNRIEAERDMRKLAIQKGESKFDSFADVWEKKTKSIEKYGEGYVRLAGISNRILDTKLPRI